MSEHLILYMRPTCPFCVKVISFMERAGIDIPMRNISEDPDAERTLIDVGGKRQVPCLFIDGKPLYESDDIIAYLRDTQV